MIIADVKNQIRFEPRSALSDRLEWPFLAVGAPLPGVADLEAATRVAQDHDPLRIGLGHRQPLISLFPIPFGAV
jgi:hypothetical protein